MRRRDALLGSLLVAVAAGTVAYVAGRREARPPAVDGDPRAGDEGSPDAGAAPPRPEIGATAAPTLAPGGVPQATPAPATQPRGDQRIEGRVTDAAGRPVAGATVEGRALPSPTEGSRPPLVATTDAEGRFVLAGLAAGRWAVLARHPGYAGALPVAADAGSAGITLQLGTLGWLEGTVRRADGAGLTGAWIAVAFPEGGSSKGVELPVVDGRFRSAGLLATRWTVVARPEGAPDDTFVTATPTHIAVSDGVATTVDLVLQRGGVLRGRVEDADAGGPLAAVEIRGTLDGASRTGGRTTAGATVGEDGTFELTGLATGRWTFETSSSSHATARWTLDLGAEATEEHVLRLARWVSLRVRVVDERGRAVEGAGVVVQQDGREAGRHGSVADAAASDGAAIGGRTRFSTDEDGRIEVLVPPGELTVIAHSPRAHEVSDPTPVTTRPGAASAVDVVVRPRPRPEPRDR